VGRRLERGHEVALFRYEDRYCFDSLWNIVIFRRSWDENFLSREFSMINERIMNHFSVPVLVGSGNILCNCSTVLRDLFNNFSPFSCLEFKHLYL